MSAFDPIGAVRLLLEHGVRFVLIGGVAGRAWGSTLLTNDIDVCYERSAQNHAALATALKAVHATLRGAPPGLPLQLDARTFAMGDSFTFDTDVGLFDCLGTPAGTSGYADLAQNATAVELDPGVIVLVASIDDLIRMKRAADRPKDRFAIEILAALKEERERSSSSF